MKQVIGQSVWVLVAGVCAACGGDSGGTSPATHEEIAALLGAGPSGAGSCSVPSCHGTAAEANLQFEPGANLRELLVGVKACEAPALDLVVPEDPERSWLWIKLTGELEDERTGDLKPDPSWGEPATNCEDAGGFGKRMPRVSPFTLPDEHLERIRSWIEAGAPGPSG